MVKVNTSVDDIKTVTPLQQEYPKLLRLIPDPPPQLYYIGNLSLASNLCVAIVGARKASEYGKWVAMTLGKRLAEHDVTVVSGMAMGIDTYGHKGALEVGGKTVAVLGCGIDVCYPPSNRKLKEQIEMYGLVLSEYPSGYQPLPYTFPKRNRIISGLCHSTVIVEAGIASGSLITAERAADQGRNIYAVPGNITNIYSMGTNKLIADGAIPLIVVDDILKDIGVNVINTTAVKAKLRADELTVYKCIENESEVTVDYICSRTKKSAGTVNGIITVLEMKGVIYSSLGKIFIVK